MHAEYLRSYGSVLPHHHPELPEGRCCLLAFVDRDARRCARGYADVLPHPRPRSSSGFEAKFLGPCPTRPTGWGRQLPLVGARDAARSPDRGYDMTYLSGVAHPLLPAVPGLGQETGRGRQHAKLAGGAKCWLGGAAEIAHGARATGIQLNQAREWTGCARCLMSCELFTT